jgi:hypothetical protein
MTEKQYPSLSEQGKNLAKFSFDLIKNALQSGALIVSAEVQAQRLEICKVCEHYDAEQTRCKHCGCYLTAKISFALDSCPVQKWTENEETWMNENFNKVMDNIENQTP